MNKSDFVKKILENDSEFIDDEDITKLIIDEKVSENIDATHKGNLTAGAALADKIAAVAGSWGFIVSFLACLILWMALNILMLGNAFDPYPFILLNLVLSCIAAIQAPIIMMSQNRQEQKDRLRAENDYKVNLKTEIIIEDLYNKVNLLLENQKKLEHDLKKQ